MLDADAVLSTTRAVRKRLDLTRPVQRELIEECLLLAQQAPSGGNRQRCRFVVVTDERLRADLARVYRRGWERYASSGVDGDPQRAASDPVARARQRRVTDSAGYLAAHLHRVPVLVVPCMEGRTDGRPQVVQASQFGSVLPAVWSFMLAARARGLGTSWTTLHLFHEREAAHVLGIPYDRVMQTALIPVAHLMGGDLRPGVRRPLDEFVSWDRWVD